jgi:hypothetical protein
MLKIVPQIGMQTRGVAVYGHFDTGSQIPLANGIDSVRQKTFNHSEIICGRINYDLRQLIQWQEKLLDIQIPEDGFRRILSYYAALVINSFLRCC